MFGGDDFFSEIERAFFGSDGSRRGASFGRNGGVRSNVSRDENSFVSNLNADFDRVENGGDFFVVVNFLDVVKETDLDISIADDFNDGREDGTRDGLFGGGDKVLSIVNSAKSDSFVKIRIPKKAAKRDFEHKLNNGILEVRFRK